MGIFLVCIDIIHILNSLNVCLWFQIGWVSYDDTESNLEYRMNILVSPYLKSSCGFCTKHIFFVTFKKYFSVPVFHKIWQLLSDVNNNLERCLSCSLGSCLKIRKVYMYFLLKPVRKVAFLRWLFCQTGNFWSRKEDNARPLYQNKYRESIFRPLICTHQRNNCSTWYEF